MLTLATTWVCTAPEAGWENSILGFLCAAALLIAPVVVAYGLIWAPRDGSSVDRGALFLVLFWAGLVLWRTTDALSIRWIGSDFCITLFGYGIALGLVVNWPQLSHRHRSKTSGGTQSLQGMKRTESRAAPPNLPVFGDIVQPERF